MGESMKKMLVFLSIVVLIILGVISVQKLTEKNEFKEAETITKEYIKSNYIDVESIVITKTEYSPLDTIFVYGYVNDKNSTFHTNVNSSLKKVDSIGESEKFPRLKEECKNSVCD
jgi:hypothetical protein